MSRAGRDTSAQTRRDKRPERQITNRSHSSISEYGRAGQKLRLEVVPVQPRRLCHDALSRMRTWRTPSFLGTSRYFRKR
jgi:hypothetical protein